MATTRLKKFVRTSAPQPFRIQPRDHELLCAVADYRFLNTQQLLALHQGGERNLKRRLAALYHLGYLERPEAQKLLPTSGSFLIYAIGDKGAELLERSELAGKKANEVSLPYLAHAMMISQFRAVLTLALRQHPSHPKLTRWVQGYALKDLLSAGGGRTELVPDAFFTLEDKGDLLHFFLEADRGTMPRERFLAKLKIYWQWWREEYGKRTLNITRFRVLTITLSEERAQNLRRIAKEADPRKQGSNMFLFASEQSFSLAKPQDMLEPIWRSPKDETRHAILE